MSKSMGGAHITTWIHEDEDLFFKVNTREFGDMVNIFDILDALNGEMEESDYAERGANLVTLPDIKSAKRLWVSVEAYDQKEHWIAGEDCTYDESEKKDDWILVHKLDLQAILSR